MLEILNDIPKRIQVGNTEYEISKNGTDSLQIRLVTSHDLICGLGVIPDCSNTIFVAPNIGGRMKF